MNSQRGITIIELVVIVCIAVALVSIAIPKFTQSVTRNKMWDGMTTLMTFESAQLAYLAQNNKLGPLDSLVFNPDSSSFFSFSSDKTGSMKATAGITIGKFKKGKWLHTRIDTVGGMPRIRRTCSPGDSLIVKNLIPSYFN